jgi:uncharacterized protein YyaL (SSP411 family)
VLREMRSPDGGFYSAQDADSEGEEGKFFAWKPDEIRAAIDEEEARAFLSRYGVTEAGNFEHGSTVLFLARTIPEVARHTGLAEERLPALLRSAREKLFALREKRVRPALDDKILTGWNGLMISGLAWASQALEDQARPEPARLAREAAEGAFEFIRRRLARDGGRRLFATYQGKGSEGRARFNAYLDDYAFMAQAALDLARFARDAGTSRQRLEDCRGWVETVRERFRDPASPGYFFTSEDHERLIQRPKTIYDQAIPSGTAVVLQCLAALGEIVEPGESFEAELEAQLPGLFAAVSRQPYGFGELLCVALLVLQGPVALSGPGNLAKACQHPHFFPKPEDGLTGWLVCHRKSCGLPHPDVESALREAWAKV